MPNPMPTSTSVVEGQHKTRSRYDLALVEGAANGVGIAGSTSTSFAPTQAWHRSEHQARRFLDAYGPATTRAYALDLTDFARWCETQGITSIALNASEDGRAMYEAMGYAVTPSPMMFRSITPARK